MLSNEEDIKNQVCVIRIMKSVLVQVSVSGTKQNEKPDVGPICSEDITLPRGLFASSDGVRSQSKDKTPELRLEASFLCRFCFFRDGL